jgi:hypothetical protein
LANNATNASRKRQAAAWRTSLEYDEPEDFAATRAVVTRSGGEDISFGRTRLRFGAPTDLARGQIALKLVAIYKALGGGWQVPPAHDGIIETPPSALPEPGVELETVPALPRRQGNRGDAIPRA